MFGPRPPRSAGSQQPVGEATRRCGFSMHSFVLFGSGARATGPTQRNIDRGVPGVRSFFCWFGLTGPNQRKRTVECPGYERELSDNSAGIGMYDYGQAMETFL